MEKNISKFFHATGQNFKNLRKALQDLKKEREKTPVTLVEESKEEEEEKTPERIVVYFSLANVAKATLTIIALVTLSRFVQEIGHVLLLFFIAVLFAAALNPTVRALEKRRIPRPVSVIAMFLILLFILGFFVSQLIPLVATQLLELAKSLTSLLSKLQNGTLSFPFDERIQSFLQDFLQEVDRDTVINQIQETLKNASSQLEGLANNTFAVIKTVFNGLFNFVVVLVLTFFLVTNDTAVNGFFISLFPSKHGKYIVEKIEIIQNKVGYWLRGQIVLMLLMFTLSLLGLLILQVDNALTLAMMTGIAELLPVVGPIFAGIPAILVAFNQSPLLALSVVVLIFILHELEGNVLVPLVMRKAVGLNPIIIILAMLVGLETLGVLGMIIAIPVTTILSIFVKDYALKEK